MIGKKPESRRRRALDDLDDIIDKWKQAAVYLEKAIEHQNIIIKKS